VLAVGFTGYQAWQVRDSLSAVATDVPLLSQQLRDGDQEAARATLDRVQGDAATARSHTRGPVWWVGERLPLLGANVHAVRQVAESTDRIAGDVLPGVVATAETLSPDRLRPRRGRIDLEPLEEAAPTVAAASETLVTENDRLAHLDATALWPALASPVAELQEQVDDATGLAERASSALQLLPSMLGADGPRRYVLLFQNNAEVRATGGIGGAFAEVLADDGRIRLGEQTDAGGLGPLEEPVLPLTPEERSLFGPALGRYAQDVNFTPDFPRTGELTAAMWRESGRGRVDGVVSVDPVAMSYLLEGTGPVRTAGGRTLTADNAVPLLLSDVYAQLPDPEQQDVFFSAAARSVFAAITSGAGESRALLEGLTRGASEGRLLVWSRHEGEQEVLADTTVGGGMNPEADSTPRVGVHLNAAAAYKLDYYLDHEASLVSQRCQAGRQYLQLRLEMSSRVPDDHASLPDYVAPDTGPFGKGTIVDTLYVFAPRGGRVEKVTIDGEDRTSPQRTSLDGHPVAVHTLAIEPGERREVIVDLVTGRDQVDDPDLRVTPGVRSDGVGEVGESSC